MRRGLACSYVTLCIQSQPKCLLSALGWLAVETLLFLSSVMEGSTSHKTGDVQKKTPKKHTHFLREREREREGGDRQTDERTDRERRTEAESQTRNLQIFHAQRWACCLSSC